MVPSKVVVEKHNGIIGNMKKVLSDVALAWCLSAKDALLNSYCYSSNQLAFDYNPNFPSVTENKLPALAGVTSSELVASHLNALHTARRRFIETEEDEKLHRALKRKTRTATSLKYQTGDQVYYKKKDSSYWKGPGMVIGYYNKQVFVRHGGTYIRVSPCNLELVNKAEEDLSKSDDHQKCSDMIDSQKESKFMNLMKIVMQMMSCYSFKRGKTKKIY